MFSSLSGLTEILTTFIREPVTPLGNAIHDAIYANSYNSGNFQRVSFVMYTNLRWQITDMVLSTNDPDALDEVWFVLAKAMGSSNNSEIRTALKWVVAGWLYSQAC